MELHTESENVNYEEGSGRTGYSYLIRHRDPCSDGNSRRSFKVRCQAEVSSVEGRDLPDSNGR